MKSTFTRLTKLFLLAGLFFISACEKEEVNPPDTLSVNLTKLDFVTEGGSKEIIVETNAELWTISNPADWLDLSATTGRDKRATITLTVNDNSSQARRDTLTITAGNATPVKVVVSQAASEFNNISPTEPDASGMSSTAMQLAEKISLGWNLGNSLEAIGGETNWGNPKTTKALIDLVKQNGFDAVRIPVAWNEYLENSATAEIKSSWLSRVKEVVDYAIDNDMYVIINIHWDGGWLENNITPEKQDEVNAKQRAFWEQIATYFRDYDEHLIFASANEPHVENATQMAVLKSYHQTFIDAVRSTGGRNSFRNLVVQGPSTDIDKTNNLMTSMPTDEVSDRLMAEVHFYTPWNFAGLTQDESWGKMFYYWGSGNHSTTDPGRNPNWGEEETVDALFAKMKTQFVDKGIPVVLGEYGAIRRSDLTGEALTKHLESRAYYLNYVTRKAKENGFIPFYWDNGATGNNGFALFNRNTHTVSDQQALEAITEAINQ